MPHTNNTIHPELWEDLIGGLAGQQLRTAIKSYRSGEIEKAYSEFDHFKLQFSRDLKIVDESFQAYFGYPHPELTILNSPHRSLPADYMTINTPSPEPAAVNTSPQDDVQTTGILVPTSGLLIRHHLALLDHRPVTSPALYVFENLKKNSKFSIIALPHPMTMVLGVLLLCLIAGTGGSVLSVYNTRLHPVDKIAGVAIEPSATPLPELTESENIKIGFTIMHPKNLNAITTDEGWEFTPQSGNGKLILSYTNNVIVSQTENQNNTEEEKALFQFTKTEAEKSFRKIDPKSKKINVTTN